MHRTRWSILSVVGLGLVAILAFALTKNPHTLETMKSLIAREFPPLRGPFQQAPQIAVDVRLAEIGFHLGQPALIRVFKQEAMLEVWMKRGERFERVFTYPICKWSGALGPKLQEGDGQSPEGYYFASAKQLLPSSRHHRAINTGFPNRFDAALGRTGTVLMIHGSCSSIGCYAMTDPAIDDIYRIADAALLNGQSAIPLHLYPFRMTSENLSRNAHQKWIGFWRNLAEGDGVFAATGLPPPVWACGGKYHFAGTPENCQKVVAW
jgi:murein L,D-transpeptidase YafK